MTHSADGAGHSVSSKTIQGLLKMLNEVIKSVYGKIQSVRLTTMRNRDAIEAFLAGVLAALILLSFAISVFFSS